MISFTWSYKETDASETGTLWCGKVIGTAIDCDGDFTAWEVKVGRWVAASGEESGINPYHFDVAQGKIEQILRRRGLTPDNQREAKRLAAKEKQSGSNPQNHLAGKANAAKSIKPTFSHTLRLKSAMT